MFFHVSNEKCFEDKQAMSINVQKIINSVFQLKFSVGVFPLRDLQALNEVDSEV